MRRRKKEDEREKGIKKNITDINSVPVALPSTITARVSWPAFLISFT